MPIEYLEEDYFQLKSSASAVFRRRKVSAVLPHFHAFDEVIFIRAGSGTHVVNQSAMDFVAGDILVVPAGCQHHYRNILELSIVCLLLRPEQMRGSRVGNSYEKITSFRMGGPSHVRPQKRLFGEMVEWLALLEQQSGHSGDQELLWLLELIALSQTFAMPSAHATLPGHGNGHQLAPGLKHLETHFADEDPMAPLCDLVHMSPRTLLRRFHEASGRSPVQYVSDLRMHHAMLELRRCRRPILDIALDCGFNDLSYFHRRFRKITGLTPNNWRKDPAHLW